MATMTLSFLTAEELQQIHDASLYILERAGVRVDSPEALELLAATPGVAVDGARSTATFNESAVMAALDAAPPAFTVYGRDRSRSVTYGEPGFVNQSIPGETQWVEPATGNRREPTMEEFERCVVVADALPHVDVVGAMVQPAEIPIDVRDVILYAELFKRTRKPVRGWIHSRGAAHYVLELALLFAGGAQALRDYPLIEFGIEPVSPLQLPAEPLAIALDFARAGVPITIGPMPQAMATAPVTLAGAVTLGNTEALATLVVVQAAAPGVPVTYFSGPHIMDPRTMNLVFSSPEQGVMGAMVAQLGKWYGLPVGVNVGLTDANVPDAQAGLEKGITMAIGALAGADIFGGMGIAGCDQGFSLPQLVIDDEMVGFIRRMVRDEPIDAHTIAAELIARVGIGESFLMEDHTLDNWRQSFWLPQLCERNNWDVWQAAGGKTMLDRAIARQEHILAEHTLPWLDEATRREVDRIVAAAQKEMLTPA